MTSLSLKTKITVAVSLLTAALLSILAFSAQLYFANEIKQLASSQQFTMLSAIADQIDDRILASQAELVATAENLGRQGVSDPVRLHRFFAERRDSLAMFDNGLFLFSATGEVLAGNHSNYTEMLGRNFASREYLKKTVTTRSAQISEPFISAQAHHHPILMFTAPVFDGKGEMVAILSGSLDLTKNNFLAKLASIRLGENGYLYLYNQNGLMIVHKDRDRIMKQDVAPGVNLLYDKALAGFEGSGETTNSRNLAAISSFKRLKSTGWILACNFPQSEAYATAYKAKRCLLVAVLAVLAVSVVVVWLTMKHLTAPLLSFTRQIRALTRGESPQTRITVDTGDEIGLLGDAFNQLLGELELQKLELKKQLRFSQILIDTAPVPVFYKDAQGLYLGCNLAFEQFLGLSRSELVGKSVYDIAPSELAEVYHRADRELAAKGGLQVYETDVLYADGSEHQVVFYKTTFPAADGSVGGLVGVMLDITERKKAEAAQQAQKEFAESLVQNFTAPAFVLDREHRVLIWNRACEALTGRKAAEVLGSDDIWKIFYPSKRPLLADLVLEGDLEALPRHYQVHNKSPLIPEGVQAGGWYLDPQGKGHYITLNAAPIRDSHGAVIGVLETLDDITERKREEEAHEQTRRRLQLILDAAGEGINGVDMQGRVTFVNPAAAQMVGWDQEELLGKNQHQLMHHTRSDGTPYPEEECPIFAGLRNGKSYLCDNEIFWRKDGTSFPVEYISTPLRENGELVGAVVIYRDTTERNQVEEQLLKLSQAVMQSPVSVMITDTSGNIEFVNPKFTETTGYSQEEVMGQNPRLLKGGKTPPEVYQNLWSTITSGRVWNGELFNLQKNGETYWEHATISPIRNSAGAISHYMAFMESMTERKRLEEQLRQAQKMEAVGQLAGGVAHDFNNILTVIMGFGQILHGSLDGADPKRSHMEQILDAADRATHLTKSLLAFSRKQVMLLLQLELNELARKHTQFMVRIIGEDITLKTEFTEKPLLVLADGGQIEQVLMNLATNARDAMPGGGELCIRTESVQLGKEFYQQHGYGVPGSYALITVSDTGGGMDPSVQEKIFEPFFTTKAPGRGTGLGLSIVYGIVKQHGGYITIHSQVGLGTTFSIYLPLVAGKRESVVRSQSVLPEGGKETILVVEDDPAVRNLVESVLKRYGYRVVIAESGEEAITLFQAKWQDIDLALLDVIMPKMNGKQVCEALRQLSPRLKVLFLSGYTADLIQDKGIPVEGIDIITKPAKPVELARKIREMLDSD